VGEDRTPPVRRATVAEAVHGRVRRGTITVEREGGTVYVLLEGNESTRTTGDPSRTGRK
jgi:hypothetical protein